MTLTGSEMEEWGNALIDAYDVDELDRVLKYRLDQNLRRITATNLPYDTIIFNVLRKASSYGWEFDLLRAARESNPGNPALQVLGQKYGLAMETPSNENLESIIKRSNRFYDIDVLIKIWGELETRICRVEIKGEAAGTAFLAGPSVVLTNYHVIEDVHKGQAKPEDIKLRFDYKVLRNGVQLPGTIFSLVKGKGDWLIAWSPYNASDCQPESKIKSLPSEEELDYALLLVEGTPGKSKLGEKPYKEAPPRGWVELPDTAYALKPKSDLHIIQHPKDKPLKLMFGQEAVLGLNGNGTRVRYTTNTEHGSSGSPCFDADWNVIALHHCGEPKHFLSKPSYNEGIPIQKIVASLRQRGLIDVLQASSVSIIN